MSSHRRRIASGTLNVSTSSSRGLSLEHRSGCNVAAWHIGSSGSSSSRRANHHGLVHHRLVGIHHGLIHTHSLSHHVHGGFHLAALVVVDEQVDFSVASLGEGSSKSQPLIYDSLVPEVGNWNVYFTHCIAIIEKME